MVFDCLWVVVDVFEVVVEFFEVVLGGCRSFLRLVTTYYSYIHICIIIIHKKQQQKIFI